VSAPALELVNPRGLPRELGALCGGLIGIGVIAFLFGISSHDHASTAWRAFHVNYLYYAALSQGAIVLASAFVIVGAGWPGPVRRIAEGLGAWVSVSVLLFLIGFLGRHELYPWIEHPIAAKEAWLRTTRLFWTDLGILVVLAVLSNAFLYYSLRPTLHGAAQKATGAARTVLQRWTAGWRGEEQERRRCDRALRRLAPLICLAYAFGYTVLCFDQVMSLAPAWFSNLFGAYFAWGGFLSAIAVTALMCVLHRNSPGLEGEITRSRMHDLGKMIFAFSIFWMYLFWSQYLVIWYGNLPEETAFLEARLGSQFLQDKSGFGTLFLIETWDSGLFWERLKEPYAKLTLTVWLCCWIVPFWVLLGQRPKRTPAILGSVGLVVALGFWLERNVLIWPSLVPGDSWAWVGGIQLAVAAGFLGAFLLVFLVFTRLVPSLPVRRDS
jgi:hypothetical protein